MITRLVSTLALLAAMPSSILYQTMRGELPKAIFPKKKKYQEIYTKKKCHKQLGSC
jgi:hypothetical protein